MDQDKINKDKNTEDWQWGVVLDAQILFQKITSLFENLDAMFNFLPFSFLACFCTL